MSDLKIQGEVSLDTSNADAAFARVEQSGKRMAQQVEQAGQKAGKAVNGIGDGAAESAKKVDDAANKMAKSVERASEKASEPLTKLGDEGDKSSKKIDAATKSMIQSIQRTTAVMEAGSKSSTRYYEVLAAQRGVDVSALKPYLAQLDAVTAKQKQAESALASTVPTMDKVGVSAAQTAAAMRQLPAQFSDIVVSLQGGQNPLTVLLQQGSQIKDSFGGIGPAARALGGYVAGLANPFTIAAAAAGVLAVAYFEGGKEAKEYAQALILTGNAAGTTVSQMQVMAANISAVVGTQGKAAESLVIFAQGGKVAANSLEEFTAASIRFERVTGQAVSETAKQFAELKKEPLEASIKLNEGINFLTMSIYEQIKALSEQGKATEAANVAQKAFADTINDRASEIVKNLGLIERGWQGIKDVATGAWDAIKGVGRQDGIPELEKEIERLQNKDKLDGWGKQRLEEARQELAYLMQQVAVNGLNAKAEAERAAQVKARAEFDKESLKYLDKQAQMRREIAKVEQLGLEAGASRKEIESQIAAIREKYKEKSVGQNNSELANIKARITAEQQYLEQLRLRGTEADKLVEGERLVLKYTEELNGKLDGKTRARTEALLVQAKELANTQKEIEATKEALKQQEEFRKAREKEEQAFRNSIKSINDHARAIEDEVAAYGLGKAALEELAIARLEEERAAIEQFDGSEERIAQIDKEVEARRRLANAMASKDAKEANAEAAKKAAQDWQKSFDDMSRSLTDSIMRGGKNAGEYLKDYFRTLVLRPIVQAIVTPMAGAVQQVLGMGTAAGSATGGGLGSIMSSVSNLSTVYSAFSGGIASTIAGAISSAGSMFGSSALSSFAAGMKGASLAAGMAGPTTAGAGGAMGAGAAFSKAIPVVGWIIAGMLKNASLYDQGWNAGNGSISGSIVHPVAGTTVLTDQILRRIGLGGKAAAILSGSALMARFFGRRNPTVESSGIAGTFDSEGFSGYNYANWVAKGGYFRSDKRGTQISGMDPEVVEQFTQSLFAIKATTVDFAKSLGLPVDVLEDYSKSIKLTWTSDAEVNKKLISDMFDSIGNELASMLADFSSFAKGGETATETMQRLSLSLTSANAWMSMLRQRLFQVSLAGADAASKLIDTFGGLENLSQVSAQFYDLYYSEGERAARSAEEMQKALESVNLSMPKTKDELRAMAASLDLNTEAGRAAYATLLTIAPEFANVADTTKRLAQEAAKSLVEAFTARGQLAPALDASKLKINALTAAVVNVGDATGNISRIFLNASSGLIYFGSAAGQLSDGLTDAQASALLLTGEIEDLRANADSTRINIVGLGAALAAVNTDTFIEAFSLVFDKIAERIRSVIDSISDERVAVREAALQIINPTVMSKSAIQREIASINTALPGNGALIAAQAALTSADTAYGSSSSNLNGAKATLSNYQASLSAENAVIASLEREKRINQAFIEAVQINLNDLRDNKESEEKRRLIAIAENDIKFAENNIAIINGQLATASQNVQSWNTKIEQQQQAIAQAQAQVAEKKAILDAAVEQSKQAQVAYADALQNFAIDASKSVSRLSKLREETVKYYEAQKQLADLMTSSAAAIRQTVSDYRYSQMTPQQQFEELQTRFSTAYAMGLSTDGETLASYGNQLNTLIGPLLEKARETLGSDSQYNVFAATVIARAEAIAGRLETLTPTNYAADSLAMLEQIDATLAALDTSARSAEQLIVNAINAGRDQTVGGLRAVVAALTGQTVPAFATGGDHIGGLRLVGENGPELEATGPARIFNAADTRAILSGSGTSDLVAELRALRADNADMRLELQAIASYTNKTARQLDRFEQDGLVVRTETDSPLLTEVA